jgi:Ca2+-binding EF-hand superfamily protein
MKEVFDTYDKQNVGFIKPSLLGKILRTLGFNPLESDIQRVIKEVDPDRKNFVKIKLTKFKIFILR